MLLTIYLQGERDYDNLSSGTPSWKGNNGAGHGSTYGDDNGGATCLGASRMAQWLLRGDTSAAQWFKGGSAANGYTDVESKNLDSISVTPI